MMENPTQHSIKIEENVLAHVTTKRKVRPCSRDSGYSYMAFFTCFRLSWFHFKDDSSCNTLMTRRRSQGHILPHLHSGGTCVYSNASNVSDVGLSLRHPHSLCCTQLTCPTITEIKFSSLS